MVLKIKNPNGWAQAKKIFVKTPNGWVQAAKGYIKSQSGWRRFFPTSGTYPAIQQDVTLSADISTSTGLLTLTGTNYHWSDADSYSYSFEKSTNNGVKIGRAHV